MSGCLHFTPERRIDTAVASAASAAPPELPAPATRPGKPALATLAPPAGKTLSLAALVDFALRKSPLTRAAWYDARAAAAQVGSREAAYYPVVEVDGQVQFQHQTAFGGKVVSDSANWGPAATLSYLVLDLGGRAADVDEARAQLAVANFTHGAALQDLVLKVEQAYYQLLAAKALREATASNLREAETALEAAVGRQRAGVATLADVLQAKTAASQARLTLRAAEGLAETAKGVLSAALGLPATFELEVGELPATVAVRDLDKSVESLVAEAERQRPELAAARGQVARAEAHTRSVWSAGLPNLLFAGSANRQLYLNPSTTAYGDNYGAQLLLRVPVFDGFRDTYNNRQSEEAVQAALARVEATEQQVVLQVWTSYQALRTATQRVGVARDLLDSAKASADVATGRYEAGAGTLVDLLIAQAALSSARAQEVQSRADYLVALAELAHDTGALGPRSVGRAAQGEATP